MLLAFSPNEPGRNNVLLCSVHLSLFWFGLLWPIIAQTTLITWHTPNILPRWASYLKVIIKPRLQQSDGRQRLNIMDTNSWESLCPQSWENLLSCCECYEKLELNHSVIKEQTNKQKKKITQSRFSCIWRFFFSLTASWSAHFKCFEKENVASCCSSVRETPSYTEHFSIHGGNRLLSYRNGCFLIGMDVSWKQEPHW